MKIHEDQDYFFFYRVEEEGVQIRDILWADDVTGEYEKLCRDESDELIVLKDILGKIAGMKTEVKKGNIKIVDSRLDKVWNV